MKRIGKYDVLGLLGRGGMSRVYLVSLPVIDKLSALKRFAPHPTLTSLVSSERTRSLFITEAKLLAALKHPHIVDIQDFEDEPSDLFYTMEYHPTNLGIVIGEYWRTEATSRQLPVDNALRYGSQMCHGIAALHHAGIVHRDLKPFNMLITDTDDVKICDFGLSRIRGERFPVPASLKVGSPYYTAPEQAENPEQADERADLYAAGVILFRMLTGRLPETTGKEAHLLNPVLDARWSRFFTRATHPDRDRRFQDIHEMQDAMATLETWWDSHRERVCDLEAARPPERERGAATLPVRTQSMKVLDATEARSCFQLNRLWEPKRFSRAEFADRRQDIIEDRVYARFWQRSGSPYPVNYRDALRYVEQLNRSRAGGLTDWRLPTIDELLTLITGPPGTRRICTPALFDQRQRGLWSADRRTFTSAYYVSTEMGFVAWQNRRALCHVRAVCRGTGRHAG